MPETKALLMFAWSRYLMKYPRVANVSSALSSLKRNFRSSGDLSARNDVNRQIQKMTGVYCWKRKVSCGRKRSFVSWKGALLVTQAV